MSSAIALTDCTVLRIDRKEMMRAVHEEHAFFRCFVAYLLLRNSRTQENLIDQLFNSSEKRLARALLLLATRKEGKPESGSQGEPGVLAEMIGTTRSRINFFYNRITKRH